MWRLDFLIDREAGSGKRVTGSAWYRDCADAALLQEPPGFSAALRLGRLRRLPRLGARQRRFLRRIDTTGFADVSLEFSYLLVHRTGDLWNRLRHEQANH